MLAQVGDVERRRIARHVAGTGAHIILLDADLDRAVNVNRFVLVLNELENGVAVSIHNLGGASVFIRRFVTHRVDKGIELVLFRVEQDKLVLLV